MTKNNSSGFTLVELLVAIAVAVVVIASLNEVVTSYIHTAQRGRYLNMANAYAESKVETLRNNGYNSLTLGTSNISSELPSQLPSPKSATMTVTSPGSGLKEVAISVSYKDQGQTNTLAYASYIGELGVGQ